MNAKAEMIKDTICILAQSQGSYGRMVAHFGGADSPRFHQACEELAKVDEITSPISLIIYLEG